ncbi:MAG TPA: peptide chain release factor N(5)-glutamine methyltransferase [Spongiibacteraceae bacterium]|nr:peptide chain release factor N(5)-glutamine methyltransferase [Spongiibacteraceae bacterium]
MTIRDLLGLAYTLADSDSPTLDAELLLSHCLKKNRTYLYTWPEREIAASDEALFRELMARRLQGEPIAYLTGEREFWSLPLAVNNSTLIPRPDTERLVEVALEVLPQLIASVLDLGTGSGAIALALASQKPAWSLCGVDIDADAVRLANHNARNLSVDNVTFFQSDWFAALSAQKFDAIVSNPPYIDADDPHLLCGDVRFEPRRALVAEQNGLADIAAIAAQAPSFLQPGGWLLFEHGYEQGPAVRSLLSVVGFRNISTWNDWGGRERVSGGAAP